MGAASRDASRRRPGGLLLASKPLVSATPASFVPMQLPSHSASADIRIELRRGATAVTVTWPSVEAAQRAAWMRELLK